MLDPGRKTYLAADPKQEPSDTWRDRIRNDRENEPLVTAEG